MIQLPNTAWGWWRLILIPLTLVFFLGLTVIALNPSLLQGRRTPSYSTAKLTMRALGSSQLAYNNHVSTYHQYGSWNDLVATDYISQGYTRMNMIDNYSISVWNVGYAGDGSFTIVAVPRNPKLKLDSYCIREDQVVRYRSFKERKSRVAPWKWDPLR